MRKYKFSIKGWFVLFMIGRNSFILTLILTVATAWDQSESVHQENSLLSNLEYQRPAFEFTEVVDGVYCARGTGNLLVWCNATIIVNESDVIIVDSHVVPAAAVALLEELREVTQKPVRYLINTPTTTLIMCSVIRVTLPRWKS